MVDASTQTKCADILAERGRLDLVLAVANAAETEPWTRASLAEILNRRERVDDARSVLQRLVKDSSATIGARANAVAALGRIGGVTELLRLANDRGIDADIRKEAVWFLGGMTDAADRVLPELRCLVGTDVDNATSPAIHDALRHIQFGTQVSVSGKTQLSPPVNSQPQKRPFL